MYVIKGKYNIAKIMLPEMNYLDDETTKQVYGFLNNPSFQGSPVVIMPDAHAGKGSCIGFTKPINDYVIPAVVGVDIGCGMLSWEIPKELMKNFNFEWFDKFIRNNIPSGHSICDESQLVNEVEADMYEKLSVKIGQTVDPLRSLGSLGGGNHFIEIDKSDRDRFFLVIHSGSRNFGLKICEYHQNKAKELMKKMFIGDAYKGLEFLPLDMGGKEYIADMMIAQQYARTNRFLILRNLFKFFDYSDMDYLKDGKSIDCVHNYISSKDNIIRKGAISAQLHEQVIIPLNMRDGIIFGQGKGNKEWNYSAPHGAGRILSRKQAKERIGLEKVKEQMKDVWTSSLSKNTIDEAPDAYKKSEMIIDAIGDTVHIHFIAKPLYNFKAGE